jgi:hypothetical protein
LTLAICIDSPSGAGVKPASANCLRPSSPRGPRRADDHRDKLEDAVDVDQQQFGLKIQMNGRITVRRMRYELEWYSWILPVVAKAGIVAGKADARRLEIRRRRHASYLQN